MPNRKHQTSSKPASTARSQDTRYQDRSYSWDLKWSLGSDGLVQPKAKLIEATERADPWECGADLVQRYSLAANNIKWGLGDRIAPTAASSKATALEYSIKQTLGAISTGGYTNVSVGDVYCQLDETQSDAFGRCPIGEVRCTLKLTKPGGPSMVSCLPPPI